MSTVVERFLELTKELRDPNASHESFPDNMSDTLVTAAGFCLLAEQIGDKHEPVALTGEEG